MTQDEAFEQLNVTVDLIPPGSSNRPGTKIQPTHITIHNTSNASKGADALMHAKYVKGPDARLRKVSWHFTVDDKRCIKHLPTNEKGWHAGSGNSVSIGIEVCEHKGINKEAAIERAALLSAVMMLALGIPSDRIVPHQAWTGKDCPHIILREPGGFGAFRDRAAELLSEIQSAPAGVAPQMGVAPQSAVALAFSEEAAGGLMALAEQTTAPAISAGPAGGPSVVFGGSAEDYVAELERTVGRLAVENERLRRAVSELHDVTFEAD